MRPLLRHVKKDESVSLMDAVEPRKPRAPRQKRAKKTRARLLEAVETLVAAEGADAVTTTRIAAETGVAVGTIYRYFTDRDALLLAAYDATVGRIVETCHDALEKLPVDARMDEAAGHLLGVYLSSAEAIPAHSGLLVAMRRLRPIEAEGAGEDRIIAEIVAPFFARFAPAASSEPLRLHLMSTLLGTMVDLYLLTAEPAGRALLRAEIEAHVLLMVDRAINEPRMG